MSQLHSSHPALRSQHGRGCKNTSRVMQNHSRWCLLWPVRADQSQQYGLCRKGALKGAAAMDSIFFKHTDIHTYIIILQFVSASQQLTVTFRNKPLWGATCGRGSTEGVSCCTDCKASWGNLCIWTLWIFDLTYLVLWVRFWWQAALLFVSEQDRRNHLERDRRSEGV